MFGQSLKPSFTYVCLNLSFRVDWLQQGSREVFGTILEEQVYILIDTSQSMKEKLAMLKEKVFQLMQVWDEVRSQANVITEFGLNSGTTSTQKQVQLCKV